MTTISVDLQVPAAGSYRAARVKSLFNATDEQATRFRLDADLGVDLTGGDWQIGVIAGPSGSGKTSIGRGIWGPEAVYDGSGWPEDAPIIDGIAPAGDFNEVTGALAAAGLGDVPTWLRPYRVLSTGQRFRADLARVLAEQPDRVVLDEFTSVVDRQIATVGAGAFAKAWRRTSGRAVLLTCHYDILDWVEPDWVYDTATRSFQTKEYLQYRRPPIDLEIRLGGWDLWPLFKPHHYLDLPKMIGAKCYAGFIDGEPVVHLGIATKNVSAKRNGRVVQTVEARGSRLVVLPEWQGAGVGLRFLDSVCAMQLAGTGVLAPRRMTTIFHTSHPGLAAALRRSPSWRQVSGSLYGGNKAASTASITAAHTDSTGAATGPAWGFGGHLRAVQGFRFYGPGAR